jgi:urease accessory protein
VHKVGPDDGVGVRARSRLRIDAAGRVTDMVEVPPVAWRPTPDAVYLVGTAGALTGDDDIGLDIEVAPGGALVVRSTAASVVYTGRSTTHHVRLEAGAASSVDWHPEPLIVTVGASHVQTASLRLAPTACLDWTDVVVLGRHGEAPGHAELRLDCVIAGGPSGDRPLLRHHLSVGPGAPGWAGPAVLGRNRAVGVRLRAGPDLMVPGRRHGDGWAWMGLDGPGWLLTAVAPDLPTLLERLASAGS